MTTRSVRTRRVFLLAVLVWLASWTACAAFEPPRLVRTLRHSGEVSAIAFSPDGKSLAAGGTLHKSVVVWEVGSGRRVRELADQAGGVTALAWSPDGKYLAAGRAFVRLIKDRVAINVWDARTGVVIHNLPGPLNGNDGSNDVRSLVFSPDGRSLAAKRGGGAITIHLIPGGALVRQLENASLLYHSGLTYDRSGQYLATPGRSRDRSIVLFSAVTGEVLKRLPLTAEPAGPVAYSPDGAFLAAGNRDGTISLLELTAGGTKSISAHAYSVTSLAYSADGGLLASASGERIVHLFVTPAGERVETLRPPLSARRVAFSGDGRYLAAAGDGEIWLWSIR